MLSRKRNIGISIKYEPFSLLSPSTLQFLQTKEPGVVYTALALDGALGGIHLMHAAKGMAQFSARHDPHVRGLLHAHASWESGASCVSWACHLIPIARERRESRFSGSLWLVRVSRA